MAEGNAAARGRHFFPAARYSSLPRPRLVEKARERDAAIIVFTGGAGAGKSLAARNLADALADAGEDCVWIRLEPRLGGSEAMWMRVLASVRAAGLVPEGTLAARLQSGGLSGATPALLAEAFTEMQAGRAGRGIALILDDAHHIAPGVLAELVEVTERTPQLRLIATSRNPLPELIGIETRTRVPVQEFTESDLAFTAQEIADLVDLRLPGIDEDRRRLIVAEVQHGSRGWPIACHALVVERDGDASAADPTTPSAFARSHVTRLIDSCPMPYREALLASSLVEEASPELLARMLGVDVAETRRFFDEFDEASLTHWTDEHGVRWYRHHHLIRDEVRRRAEEDLDPERKKTLYRRAAHSLAAQRPREAVQASLRGEAWEVLNDLLLEDPIGLITRERARQPGELWLRSIPAAVRDSYPVLAAFALFDEYASPAGRFPQVINGLRMLGGPRLAAASKQPGLPGAVAAVLRMVAARLAGSEELSLQLAQRSEEALDRFSPGEIRRIARSLATAYTQRAITYIHANRFREAESTLERLTEHDYEGAPMELSDYHRAHRAGLAALSSSWQGRMAEVGRTVRQCEEIGVPVGWHNGYIGTGYRVASALLRLDEAVGAEGADREAALESALGHIRALNDTADTTEHWPYLIEVEAMILEMRDGARTTLTWLAEQLRSRRRRLGQATTPKRSVQAMHVRLMWQAGLAAPKRSHAHAGTRGSVFAALSRRETGRAHAVLGGLLADPALLAHPRRHAEVLLLDAAASLEGDDRASIPAARSSAQRAVEVLDANALVLPYRTLPRRTLSRLAELVPEIPAEHGHEDAAESPAEALSAAELRALEAAAEERTIAAAGRALHLSPNTVKSQLRSAYRKLGASGRDEAIRLAYEAGLLRGASDGR